MINRGSRRFALGGGTCGTQGWGVYVASRYPLDMFVALKRARLLDRRFDLLYIGIPLLLQNLHC